MSTIRVSSVFTRRILKACHLTVDKLRQVAYFDKLRKTRRYDAHCAITFWRKGTWSLSVTRNLRLTFRIDAAEREIYDVNLEDYH
jgi:proteic killer suppression protein